MGHVNLLSFYGISVIIVILSECFLHVYIKVVFQVTDEAFLIDFIYVSSCCLYFFTNFLADLQFPLDDAVVR